MKKVICSWSGGKDSTLAFYNALKLGYEVVGLLTMISEEYERSSSHGIHYELMFKQAEAIGLPMIQKKVNRNNYEDKFKQGIQQYKSEGIQGIVFGDIELEEHKEWVEEICKDTGVEAIEPLWGKEYTFLFDSFIGNNFKGSVVSAKGDIFNKDWLGRKLNKRLLGNLVRLRNKFSPTDRSNEKENPVGEDLSDFNIMGENGEYHTFVTDGPIFDKEIKLIKTRPVKKEKYNLPHWFLDIQSYKLVQKN